MLLHAILSVHIGIPPARVKVTTLLTSILPAHPCYREQLSSRTGIPYRCVPVVRTVAVHLLVDRRILGLRQHEDQPVPMSYYHLCSNRGTVLLASVNQLLYFVFTAWPQASRSDVSFRLRPVDITLIALV